ncbi:MAG: trypsin-like peptidase domain-containing protein [Planctomycetes bacterium]|nr:trypsin-like peptidase domain-containing protein [Planctomycetota bacterium]
MIALALCLALPQVVQNESTDWNAIVARAAPAVVSVHSRVRIPVGRDEAGPFEGSGFVVDVEHGIVATNRHVAGEGVVLDLEVRFFDGTSAAARLIYADPLHDYAFLQFNKKSAPANLTEITMDPRPAEVGEEVRMIGNNGGLASTVLGGTVSNLGAYWDQDPGVAYLQTSIASAGGSSGSPIIDDTGAAIGMQSAHDEHTSYGMPAEYLDTILKKLKKGAVPTRGSVGLRLRAADAAEAVDAGAITKEQSEQYENAAIAVVEGVVPDTPADGKLIAGDIVMNIAEAQAGDLRAVELALDAGVGREIEVKFARGGSARVEKLKVIDLMEDGVKQMALFGGAAMQNLHYELRARSEMKRQGVLVAHVEAGSAAEAADLRRDDVILSVAGKQVEDVAALWKILSNVAHGERIFMVIRRPSTFDSATRSVLFISDKIWDPTRFLVRTDAGWIDGAGAQTAAPSPESRPAGAIAPRADKKEESKQGSVK